MAQTSSRREYSLVRSTDNLSFAQKVQLKYHQQSPRERLTIFFIKDSRTTLWLHVFNFVIKTASCLLYALRVVLDTQSKNTGCVGCDRIGGTSIDRNDPERQIRWNDILWVERPFVIWLVQVLLAVTTLSESILLICLRYHKGHLVRLLTNRYFLLELFCSLPWIVTVFYTPLQQLFIPAFFNCWLAKPELQEVFGDVNRVRNKSRSAMSQQLVLLGAMFFCLTFTCICGVQHLQRGGRNRLNFFDSYYFVIVSLSTVGYGDIAPDIWPSKLFITIMLVSALLLVPRQLEAVASLWLEKQKIGGTYSKQRAEHEKHVVVCTAMLPLEPVMDFLNEFYAHRQLQQYRVVLLSPIEPEPKLRAVLQTPLWASRVLYINGSALRDGDLARARLESASAAFILAARGAINKEAADRQTIMRSWAVKDYAPQCPQYVQVFRPESKMHVKFADHIVCEDELKYALLANNCMCPGLSTLVALLLHTSEGREGQEAHEQWQRTYGKHSGNEIYSIRVENSKFFGIYEGKSFSHASYQAHRKYGACLVAVRADAPDAPILLNPGPSYFLRDTDICYYFSITKEENSSFHIQPTIDNEDVESPPPTERQTVRPVYHRTVSTETFLQPIDTRSMPELEGLAIGYPPNPPYFGGSPIKCHLRATPSPFCCLELCSVCPHKRYRTAHEYRWKNRSIIIAAEVAVSGLFNFIAPLRSHYKTVDELRPIVLLLEHRPSDEFLEAIASFPLVYWIEGSITNLETIIRAGIDEADTMVVVSRESTNVTEEEALADCDLIVAVQTMSRLFPRTTTISELSKASNMRFMQFKAKDQYALSLATREKKEKEKGSNMPYMFRLPFAAGRVFSASMMDTLLYQTFAKDYLIKFVRLLVGIDQTVGSGNLSSMPLIDHHDIKTFGQLFRKLSITTSEIPICIYRTTRRESNSSKMAALSLQLTSNSSSFNAKHEMIRMVRNKMRKLCLPPESYFPMEEIQDSISYLIINPPFDYELDKTDILPPHTGKQSRLFPPRRRCEASIPAGPRKHHRRRHCRDFIHRRRWDEHHLRNSATSRA